MPAETKICDECERTFHRPDGCDEYRWSKMLYCGHVCKYRTRNRRKKHREMYGTEEPRAFAWDVDGCEPPEWYRQEIEQRTLETRRALFAGCVVEDDLD